MRASAAHHAQYLAMRSAVSALGKLGWRNAVRMGDTMGSLGYSAVRIRRNVAERQIAFALPGLSSAEVRRIARASYAHLGRTAIEAAILPRFGKKFVQDLVSDVSGFEVFDTALAEGRGALLVAGHLGNWELGGSWLAANGHRIAAVARTMKNPLFDQYLGETRAALGITIFKEADAVRLAPRHLRSGGLLGMLADQGALGLASTFVPFFGRLARTPRGPAVLAIRLEAPLIFGTCIRQPDGRFHVRYERITVSRTGDLDHDVETMVRAYTEALERGIRANPEQYFWVHRRWRRQPPGEPLLEDDDI
jgi:KDO2-lipid IV(A) lauroyltransferase